MAVLLLKILYCQFVRRLGEPGERVALLSAADRCVAVNLRAPTKLCICWCSDSFSRGFSILRAVYSPTILALSSGAVSVLILGCFQCQMSYEMSQHLWQLLTAASHVIRGCRTPCKFHWFKSPLIARKVVTVYYLYSGTVLKGFCNFIRLQIFVRYLTA
jgi:hypothetical protein